MTATLPLQSCRIFASRPRLLFSGQWLGFCPGAIDRNRSRLRAAIEADSTPGAVMARVMRRMSPVNIQFRPEFQALRRARFHAQPASFTFFDIDRNLTARLPYHASPRSMVHRSYTVSRRSGATRLDPSLPCRAIRQFQLEAVSHDVAVTFGTTPCEAGHTPAILG